MKKQKLVLCSILAILFLSSIIASHERLDVIYQESLKENIDQTEYFPAVISTIITDYCYSNPLNFFLRDNKQIFQICAIPTYRKLDFVTYYTTNIEMRIDPDFQRGTLILLENFPHDKEDEDQWFSLGIVIAHQIGIKKITFGVKGGGEIRRIYINSPVLKSENIKKRTEISDSELKQHYQNALDLLLSLAEREKKLMVQLPEKKDLAEKDMLSELPNLDEIIKLKIDSFDIRVGRTGLLQDYLSRLYKKFKIF